MLSSVVCLVVFLFAHSLSFLSLVFGWGFQSEEAEEEAAKQRKRADDLEAELSQTRATLREKDDRLSERNATISRLTGGSTCTCPRYIVLVCNYFTLHSACC